MSSGAAILVAIGLFNAAVAASPASERDKDRQIAKQYFEQGEVDYKLGRFKKALRSYTAAYEAMPLPAMLFNIGQCHRQLGNHERAIFFYEGYLKDAPDAWNRGQVLELVAESRLKLRAQQPAAAQATGDRGATGAEPNQATGASASAEGATSTPAEGEIPAATGEPQVRSTPAEEAGGRVDGAAAEVEMGGGAGAAIEPLDDGDDSLLLWTSIGGVAIVSIGVAVVVVVALGTQEPTEVLPYGSLGTLDRRTGQ